MTPSAKQVEHDADDDLVDQVADRQDGEHRGDQHAADGGGEQARPDAGRHRADQRGAERTHQELALDGHVDHAGAFAEHPGERAEDQRQRQFQRATGGVDQRHELARHLPAQERQHEADDAEPEQRGRTSGGPPRRAARAPAATATRPNRIAPTCPLISSAAPSASSLRVNRAVCDGASAPNRAAPTSRQATSADAEAPLPVPEPGRRRRLGELLHGRRRISRSCDPVALTSPSPWRCRAGRRGRHGAGRSPSPGPVRR